jgi:superfamily II DNA helicase RecQ
VLVTPESALGGDFTTFWNRQRLLSRLDRIVIDECHVVLNNQTNFRPQLQRMGQLVHAQTQMVLLTATLPPSEEGRLLERMHFPASSVQMFRARTHRPNVAYRAVHPAMDAQITRHPHRWVEAPAVVAWIQDRIRRHRPGKVIVYAPTVVQGRLMATALGCEAYYHDAVDQDAILDRFRQGQKKVIVATSALGMGIDIPDIRSIIHLGRPRTLLDYGQESGRAGRDGEPSEAIMIIPTPEPPTPWHPDQAPSMVDQALVERYIDTPCRRVVLDGYLDGIINGRAAAV